jgi:hypothetical protein
MSCRFAGAPLANTFSGEVVMIAASSDFLLARCDLNHGELRRIVETADECIDIGQ